MKRLLFLVPAFPKNEATSFTVPFIQQFVSAFCEEFKVSVDLLSLYEPIGDEYHWQGLKVIPLNGPMKGNLITKALFIRKSAKYVARLHQANNYDGLLSFWYRETALIGNLAAKKLQLLHFTWLQGQDVLRTNKYMRITRPNAGQLVALSDFQNNFLYQSFGIKAAKVAPFALNAQFMPEFNESDRPIDIMGAGSLIPIKNHSFFLEVILEIKKKRKALNVVIAGNGPLEDKYRSFTVAHNLENTVTFTGLLNHSETLDYMNRSKVFLHTSTYEGGGMVCLESLYLGCHLISTLPIVKRAGNQFLYSTNKNEIVDHILDILDNNRPNNTSHIENPMLTTCNEIYRLFF